MIHHSPAFDFQPRHRLCRGIVLASAIALFSAVSPLSAEELDLKALKSLDTKKSKSQTSYVGVYGGETTSQSARVIVEGNEYSLNEDDNAAVIGFEVGHRWRLKKIPADVALEFEGMFLSTELSGEIQSQDAFDSLEDTGLAAFTTDMNAAVFLLNGAVGVDLRRYRPYIGKVLSNFKPYAGAGLGGAQIWFRNTELTSADNVRTAEEFAKLPPTDPPASVPDSEDAESTIFASDAFVFAYEYFWGFEYQFNHKTAGFFERRKLHFDSFDDEVSDYENAIWSLGLRILYDKEDEK